MNTSLTREEDEQSNDDSISGYLKTKLMGAVRSTKESPYMKSLYNETSSVFSTSNQNTLNKSETTEVIPPDTNILLYPCYTRVVEKEYITRVKGIVSFTGSLSTKNRLLLNLAQRLTRPSANSNTQLDNQLETQLRDAIVNPSSKEGLSSLEATSSASSFSNYSLTTDTVKERMSGILARQIQKTPLNVTIASKSKVDKLIAATLYTDQFGMFEISLMTPYEPSFIAVSSNINTNIVQTVNTEVISAEGISVITDIDDTVRETGVLGDKREVFRNIFSKPFSECEIPGICDWLTQLHTESKCPIHYVSNSPWQIYNIINGFLNYFNFPVTSVHLRQYSGNIISSFTQPSAERKRPSMVNLLNEFPNRKFILIGDSGEQDLEAYLSLLPQYSNQILGVYIRVVPESLSSLGNDKEVLYELQEMLSKRSYKEEFIWNNPTGVDSDEEPEINVVPSRKYSFSKVIQRAADVSTFGKGTRRKSFNHNMNGVANDLVSATLDVGAGVGLALATNTKNTTKGKLAPLVPKKPTILKGNKIDFINKISLKTDQFIPAPKASQPNDKEINRTPGRVRNNMNWNKEKVTDLIDLNEETCDKPKNTPCRPPSLPARKRTTNSFGSSNFYTPNLNNQVSLNAPRKASDENNIRNMTVEEEINDNIKTASDIKSSDQIPTNDNSGMSQEEVKAKPYKGEEHFEIDDKRRMLWKIKIRRVMDEVPNHIDFKLWLDAKSLNEGSKSRISRELYKDE